MTFFEPILAKWIDLRKYAGTTQTTHTGGNSITCRSDLGMYYSFLDLQRKGWIYTSNNPVFTFLDNADPVARFNVTSNRNSLTDLDNLCSLAMDEGVFHDVMVPFFMAQRPLMDIPTETIRETVSYSSSLGGIGYRSSYSRVIEWHLEFVFRGIAESLYYPLGNFIKPFLKGAEVGVTVYLNGLGTINATGYETILFTPNTRNYNAPFFKGIPNMITGVLTDCQTVQIAPKDGKLMMHKISMTIAEKLIPTS